MSDDIKVGDSVTWTSSGGSSKGRVKKKLTAPLEIKGHHVAASDENPEFLVESDRGGQAAHKPGSLKKTRASSTSSGKKSSTKKPTAKKSSTTTTSKSTTRKASAKKSTTKKASAKKSTTKKSTTKK